MSDHEPVFVRKGGRSFYNPNNPLGLALIFLSLAFAVGAIVYLKLDSQWSEDELREATHKAAARLEEEPVTVDESLGYDMYIDDAFEKTGVGPSYGPHVEQVDDSAKGTATYTVTGKGTDAAFCMHLVPVPYGDKAMLNVEVTDGACKES
ncbi:hypothetical protein AQI88_29805 [Streptomyces cellostaticus]|uniref:Uncharacterized protein n=1 Tax=Streptomyces cellostaticus TaxID=67285 RepID=A0A101NGG2_9ACTN|nr:hypothetical protein [Streptomyces cellostaticus]KUM92756.1 hypothetical protein AQI88_29805 [Streptomyces cellostaticus]GHI06825.1 hypothetical protein Scel_51460 [Streptomyces cellostaticus]